MTADQARVCSAPEGCCPSPWYENTELQYLKALAMPSVWLHLTCDLQSWDPLGGAITSRSHGHYPGILYNLQGFNRRSTLHNQSIMYIQSNSPRLKEFKKTFRGFEMAPRVFKFHIKCQLSSWDWVEGAGGGGVGGGVMSLSYVYYMDVLYNHFGFDGC